MFTQLISDFPTLVVYFATGLLLQFIATLYVIFVADKHALRATGAAFATTIISTGMIYNIIETIGADHNYTVLVVYALGIAVGTYVGMKFNAHI